MIKALNLFFLSFAILANPLAASIASEQKFNLIYESTKIAQAIREQQIREVTVIGRGETFDKAAQNAAKNALTQVVGSFLDSETIVSKKTLIDAGLVEKTKEITVDISEYSQGSIQSLKILNTFRENGLAVAVAKVAVRINDFRRYIQELATGSTDISTGLFSTIATERNNLQTMYEIFYGKIFKPVAQGQVISIGMGSPETINQFYGSSYCSPSNRNAICKKDNQWLRNFDPTSSIVLPVKIALDPAFEANMRSKLENISSGKVIYYELSQGLPRKLADAAAHFSANNDDHIVGIYDENLSSFTVYYLPGLARYVEEKYRVGGGWSTKHPVVDFGSGYRHACYKGTHHNCPVLDTFNSSTVEFIGDARSVIKSFEVKPYNLSVKNNNKSQVLFVKRGYRYDRVNGMPGIGLVTGTGIGSIIISSRRFWLFLQPGVDTLRSARSISINYLDR